MLFGKKFVSFIKMRGGDRNGLCFWKVENKQKKRGKKGVVVWLKSAIFFFFFFFLPRIEVDKSVHF